jgi:hypothetical protein
MRQLYGLPLTFSAAMIASMNQRSGQAPRRSTLAYEGLPGTVYLLHFARPFGPNPSTRAQHYLGWTQNLRRRLNEHRKGRGSGVTRRAHREGVPFVLAQTWPGTTQREAELRLLGPRELCPVCQAFDPCRFLPMHPLTGLH